MHRRHFIAVATLLWVVPASAAPPLLEIRPGSPKPGDLVVFRVHKASGVPTGKLGGEDLTFFPFRDGYLALAGLSVDQKPGDLPVVVQLPGNGKKKAAQQLEGWLDVRAAAFRARELKVDSKFIQPPPAVRKRMKDDREAFARAFAQEAVAPLFTKDFIWPRKDVLTGYFGDRRIFNGKQKSQHYGLDLQGGVGDPIVATNMGKAVMVRDCYASGLTVVLHHGAQLYTVYFHLSRADVKEGALVKRGQALGLVGNSGRVTGPHLHWGVKVNGRYVDGVSLLDADFS